METKNMQGHAECGGCGAGGHGMCGRGHWGHRIAKILVVLFIFWLGVQYGELKGMLRATYSNGGYGYGMMGSSRWGQGDEQFPVGGMMSGWFRGASSQSTTTPK
ncbi:MAG: hypothetical protein NT108_03310 [Candidatus Kaiserbacteria bacterium]|nr:hypothetical protein [Candidatus Kaiserbacteria bacterium]